MSMEYEHGISTGATYSRGGTLWKTRVDRETNGAHPDTEDSDVMRELPTKMLKFGIFNCL